MATAKGKDEGKSLFVKGYLADHPEANPGSIVAAWREAGNAGTISGSLVSKVRKDLGLTGAAAGKSRTRGAAGTRPSAAKSEVGRAAVGGRPAAVEDGGPVAGDLESRAAPAGGDRVEVLIQLEGAIDGLLHEIRTAGGHPEFEEALRKARRILARSHGE